MEISVRNPTDKEISKIQSLFLILYITLFLHRALSIEIDRLIVRATSARVI